MTATGAAQMNRFQFYLPAFVDVREPLPAYDFETTEELLALPEVARCATRDDHSHFAISGNALMDISDNGFHWWVIGYLRDPAAVNLPQWKSRKYRALLNGQKVILTGDDVIASQGNELRLRGGRFATWCRPNEVDRNEWRALEDNFHAGAKNGGKG